MDVSDGKSRFLMGNSTIVGLLRLFFTIWGPDLVGSLFWSSWKQIQRDDADPRWRVQILPIDCLNKNHTWVIGLVKGIKYRKIPYLVVKTMVSYRFSFKPIQWLGSVEMIVLDEFRSRIRCSKLTMPKLCIILVTIIIYFRYEWY